MYSHLIISFLKRSSSLSFSSNKLALNPSSSQRKLVLKFAIFQFRFHPKQILGRYLLHLSLQKLQTDRGKGSEPKMQKELPPIPKAMLFRSGYLPINHSPEIYDILPTLQAGARARCAKLMLSWQIIANWMLCIVKMVTTHL